MIGSILKLSPIHLLLGHLLRYSGWIGWIIAISEVAIGVGMALGLWTRIAAVGGMVISLSLFLAISFNASPWYTSADLVYFFMFAAFVLAGAGGVMSLDSRIARRAALESQQDDPLMVVVPFADIQRTCGYFSDGRCKAIPNRRCSPVGCPYLEGVRMSLPGGRTPDGVDRRSVVLGGVAVAAAAGAGLVVSVAAVGIGRAVGGAKAPASSGGGTFPSTTGGPASSLGTELGPSSQLAVGQSATFTVPVSQDPGLVIQPSAGQFVAYDALCPHAGCTVQYASSNQVITCPCHGSEFDVATGAVLVGPAQVGLTPLTVTDSNGKLYIK
jgi:thiosulfate dehydrogenase [quinone] large subunit